MPGCNETCPSNEAVSGSLAARCAPWPTASNIAGSNARSPTGNGFLLQHEDFIPCLAEPIGCATPHHPCPTTITSGWFVMYTFLMLPEQCARRTRVWYQHYNDILCQRESPWRWRQ